MFEFYFCLEYKVRVEVCLFLPSPLPFSVLHLGSRCFNTDCWSVLLLPIELVWQHCKNTYWMLASVSGLPVLCSSGDVSLIPGSGRSVGEGNDNPLQYSCLKNFMDRRTWQATIHGVTKCRTQLRDWAHTHTYKCIPHLLKPIIYWWGLGLLPCLGYCK